jgi:hypothetical protein
VDIREKTFADEAIKQLDFLKSQHGFAGPDLSRGESPGTTVSARYHRGGTTIEASLVLWYMGEEYVATAQVADAPDGTELRTEIGSNAAHTGYQMRRALKLQAEAVRAAMHTA